MSMMSKEEIDAVVDVLKSYKHSNINLKGLRFVDIGSIVVEDHLEDIVANLQRLINESKWYEIQNISLQEEQGTHNLLFLRMLKEEGRDPVILFFYSPFEMWDDDRIVGSVSISASELEAIKQTFQFEWNTLPM